jgi:8-oxo-dGTP diphosphatase
MTARLFYLGPNPTATVIAITHAHDVLLIRRGNDPHKGMLAAPGGFQESLTRGSSKWVKGKETLEQAATRELWEETGILAAPEGLVYLGVNSLINNDPRNDGESWVESHFYLLKVPYRLEVKTSPETPDVQWIPFDEIDPDEVAFDHYEWIKKANIWVSGS